MPENSLNSHPSPYGIGGWLLIYLVLTSCRIIIMIVQSLSELIISKETPYLIPAVASTSVLIIIWNIVYGVLLYRLVRLRRGAVTHIKAMLIAAPIFNMFLPFIFSGVLVRTIGGQFSEIVQMAYDSSTVARLIGVTIAAAIWYNYFRVSKRIRNTWPEG